MNSLFESGTAGGVSSVIVLSKNQSFDIFTKVNYKGLQTALKPGMWCDTPQAMGFPNDKMQSFRKIWKTQPVRSTGLRPVLLEFSQFSLFSLEASFCLIVKPRRNKFSLELFFFLLLNAVESKRTNKIEGYCFFYLAVCLYTLVLRGNWLRHILH